MSQTMPIVLNLIAAFIGAFGQYFYKMGGIKLKTDPWYTNWEIALGIVLFCGVMVLFIWSFNIGGRLSVTYPVYASTFIIGTSLGIFLDKEPWNLALIIGTVLVVSGIMVIAFFAPEKGV